MASSAAEGEGGATSAPPSNPCKRKPFVTTKQKEDAERAELAAAKEALIDPDDPVLEEVEETHQIRHGNQRQRLRHGMKYTMYSAKFSPDGRFLLTASSDKSACLWNLKTGREVANYEHADFVRCAVFSPDGTHICTGCDDKEARIWKVEEKPLIETCEKNFHHSDWVVCVCYSPVGNLLCTVSRNSCVRVHDLAHHGLEVRKHTKRHASKVNAENLPPGGFDEHASRHGSKVNASRHGSKVNEEKPGSRETAGHGSKETTRHASKAAHLHDEENPPLKFPHEDQTWFAAFSSDAELLVTASGWERGNAIVFDVVSLDELVRIPHRDWVTSVSFGPLGGMACTWDKKGVAKEFLPLTVLTTCRDKKARIFELPDGMLYGTKLLDAKAAAKQFEEDMKAAQAGVKKLVISKKKQKEMAEAAERAQRKEKLYAKELTCFGHQNWTLCASFSHDGKRVATGSDSGSIQIFDVQTGVQITCLEQQEQIFDVSWSGSDRKICASSLDSTAYVYGGLQTLPTPEKPLDAT